MRRSYVLILALAGALFSTAVQAAPSILNDALVRRYYGFYLDRVPTNEEVASWTALSPAPTGNQLRQAFATSPEAHERVRGFYRRYLGRDANETEVEAWIAENLRFGLAYVEKHIRESDEAKRSERYAGQGRLTAATIDRLFRDYLGHPASPEAIAFWREQSLNLTDAAVASAIANSDEARARVADLYRELLGEEPPPGTVDNWLRYNLQGGLTAVRNILANTPQSAVYRTASVDRFYQDILGRGTAGDPLSAVWVEKLKTESADSVRLQIASSDEATLNLTAAFRAVNGRDPTVAELGQLRQDLARNGLAALKANLKPVAPAAPNAAPQPQHVAAAPQGGNAVVADNGFDCLAANTACNLQCFGAADCLQECTRLLQVCQAH